MLEPLLRSHAPFRVRLAKDAVVRQARAIVFEPTASDAVLQFTAGLVLSVDVECELLDVPNLQDVRIR